MATSEQGARLTEKNRQFQVAAVDRIQALLLRALLRLFDPLDVTRTAVLIAETVVDTILAQRAEVTAHQIDYLHELHMLESGRSAPDEFFDEWEDTDAVEDIRNQIIGTIVATAELSKRRSESTDQMVERVTTATTGKASTVTLRGARQVSSDYVASGLGPIGYARVPDADPCPFCAMLAARGVVGGSFRGTLYRSDAFRASAEEKKRGAGSRGFEVHDYCCCGLEPVYKIGSEYKIPGNGQQLAEEWAEITAGYSGDEAISVWRSWRRSGILPETYDGPIEGKRRRSAPATGQPGGTKKKLTPRTRVPYEAQRSNWGEKEFKERRDLYVRQIATLEADIAEMVSEGRGSDVQLFHKRNELRLRRDHLRKYNIRIHEEGWE